MTSDPIALIPTGDLRLPIIAAVDELTRLHAAFDLDTHRQDYPGTAHPDTRCIYLQWCPWDPHVVFETYHAERRPEAHYLPHATALASDVLGIVGAGEVGRIMIANLRPGGRILPHWDQGAYAHHFDRFHLPLASAPGNVFQVEDCKLMPEVGELFTFRQHLVHQAVNESPEERWHLIVDAVSPEWRRWRLSA